MEKHPSYPALAAIIPKYPRAAGGLFQAYNDILYSQQWVDVGVVDLPECGRGAIKGRKRDTETTLYVVPCSLAETVSFSWLQTAFKLLAEPEEIYLAVTSEDASIVYYKISLGIVKPPV
ncbi:tRNA intron endonuclease [Cyathus striatus]|nr:tRNA intron endonuclease [Cyathus striatus]